MSPDRIRTSTRGAELARRTLGAALLAPITVAAVWAGGHWLAALLALAALIGTRELAGMLNEIGSRPVVAIALPWSVGTVVAIHLHSLGHAVELTVVPVLAAGALLAALRTGSRDLNRALGDWVATSAAALIVGGLLGFGILLRDLDGGAGWAFSFIAVVVAADVGAYGVGVIWGRHKLAPGISPGKTWEGAAGGLVAAMGVAVGMAALFDLEVSAAAAVGLGVLLWAGALCGDLLESALKRRAGAKDSGTLVPGHGGLLDRLDSVLLSLVLCYIFAAWVAA